MKSHLREKKKSGSALLVVLGFLSFMVVSAVAFAIYMRAERVPSSALRRNVATRHLVKAAMAHAMSRVDDAIRDDPFPGVANTVGNDPNKFYHDGGSSGDNAMDVWYGRVFMPPNPEGLEDENGNRVQRANDPVANQGDFAWRFAPVTETVSVLNLEALGYIPPPLVNDVRFLSRSTWTAKWQNFPFDAGRFAFCAVNVSDYFDINRTKIGLRSSPLDSCISLLGTITATRKNDGSYDMASMPDVTELSRVLGPTATGRQSYSNPDGTGGSQTGGTVPYVSMLDYNLALGNQPYAGDLIRSFFYPWIMNQGDGEHFYNGTEASQGVQQAMRQPFVTDSYATNETYEIDFATLDGQPFSDIDMRGDVTVQQVAMATGSKCVKRMYDRGILGEADVFTLYDYLDHNDVPLSLAMPCVECVPMVTAVQLAKGGFARLKVNPPENPNGTVVQKPAPGETGLKITEKTHVLDPSSFNPGPGVRVLVSFPFRHTEGRNNDFSAQVAMKVFVAAGDVHLRPTGDLASLYPKSENHSAEWDSPEQPKPFGDTGDVLLWSFYSNKLPIDTKECTKQTDALLPLDITSWSRSPSSTSGNQPFFTEIEEQQVRVSETGDESTIGEPTKAFRFDLRPFLGGNLVPAGRQEGDYKTIYDKEFKVYAVVWVRITNSSGDETFDLAPAIVSDDRLNNKNNNFIIINNIGGTAPGFLKFEGDRSYNYKDLSTFALDAPLEWSPNALATVDPRYNYAPEDWFAFINLPRDQRIEGGDWLDEIADAGYFNVSDDRDPDIFMFTSNQGYLQSLGEFAFLPRLSEWNDHPSGRVPSILASAPSAGGEVNYVTTPKSILNNECAWRTYYLVDRAFYEGCASVGIGRDTSMVPTVNPYSDNEHVLLAAFANTPCDYWTTGRIVAGMKKEDLSDEFAKIVDKMGDKNQTSGDAIKNVEDALNHAFSENNKEDSTAKIEFDDIVTIMANVTSLLRSSKGDDGKPLTLEESFEKLPWFSDLDPKDDTSFENFMGAKLSGCPLYSIDRKFLYSYWRDCFANKQQLFLLFVRAESTALGGPGEGTPSQQGGRAVALVWREPATYDDGRNPNSSYSDNIGRDDNRRKYFQSGRRPHRMRVLFYHQFD